MTQSSHAACLSCCTECRNPPDTASGSISWPNCSAANSFTDSGGRCTGSCSSSYLGAGIAAVCRNGVFETFGTCTGEMVCKSSTHNQLSFLHSVCRDLSICCWCLLCCCSTHSQCKNIKTRLPVIKPAFRNEVQQMFEPLTHLAWQMLGTCE